MADQQTKLVITAVDRATEIINKISGSLGGLQSTFGKLSQVLAVGGSVTWLANMARQSLEALDRLDDLSQGLGITAQKLSALELTAKAAGVGQEELANGLNKFNNLITAAAGGTQDAVAVFKAMGVEFKDASGQARSMDDVLGDVAERMRSYENGAQKAALANELFGRTGARFIAFLNEGKDGLTKFGGVSDRALEESKELNAEIDKLSASWEKLKLEIGGATAALINWVAEASASPTLNSSEQVAGRLEAAIAANRKLLAGRLNAEARQAIEMEIADQEARLEAIRRQMASASAFESNYPLSSAPNAAAAQAAARAAEQARKDAERLAEQRRQASAAAMSEVTALELTAGGTEKLTAAQQLMLKIGQQLRDGQVVWTQQLTRETFARLEAADAAERKAKADDEELKTFDEATKALLKSHEAAKTLVADLEAEAEALKLTGTEREISIELRKLEKTGVDETSASYEKYREAIIKAVTDRETLKASQKAAEDAATEWKRAAEQIEQSLTDALVRGFEGGRSIMKSIGDWIANYFRTTIARSIAQALMGAIATGMSSLAQASGGSSSGLGSALSIGSSLFGGGGGGGLGSALGIAGSIFGAGGAAGAFGAGLMGTLGISGVGTTGALTAAGSLMGTGTLGGAASGAMMGLGAVAPYLAAAYGLYRIISGVGTGRMRGPAWQQYGITGPGQGLYAGGINNLALGGAGYYSGMTGSVAQAVNAAAKLFGGSGNAGTTYGLYSSTGTEGSGSFGRQDVIGAAGRLLFSYGGNYGSQGDMLTAMGQQIPNMILAGLKDSALPKQIKAFFEAAGGVDQDTLNKLIATATAAHQMAEAFKDLGGPFAELTDLSVEARVALADLTGGMDAFAQKVSGYYSNYYSAEEQQALSLVQAQRILQAAGIDTGGLSSRAAFRSAVEGLNVNTPQGQQQFAAYMNAAGAFASGSDLLALTGMNLRDFTAGAPGLEVAVEPMVAAQDQTNTLLAAIADAIRNQQINVNVTTNEPSTVEVGWISGGGN